MTTARPSRLPAGALLVLLAGCGGQPTGPDVDALKGIVDLYGQYAATHKGKPPANEAEFRAYVVALEAEARAGGVPSENPSNLKATRFDKFFVSTRDGRPFVIRYGTPVSYAKSPDQILALEAVGVGGKKLAVYSNGFVVERPASEEP